MVKGRQERRCSDYASRVPIMDEMRILIGARPTRKDRCCNAATLQRLATYAVSATSLKR